MNAIPALLVLTDRHLAPRPLVEVIAAAVAGGPCAVVLREKDLPRAERAALAADIAPIVHAAGSVLLSAGDLLPGCDGVHLAAGQRLAPAAGASGAPDHMSGSHAGDDTWGATIVGRSCHSRSEIEQTRSHAAAGGIDYVTVSPVYATSSKPGYGPVLGPDCLAALAVCTWLPVYALGGITTPAQARACLEAGAGGVAVMGAVMRSADPAGVVTSLHTAITGAVA